MPPESKKLSVLPRVVSRFSNRRSKPAVTYDPDQLEGSSIVTPGPPSSFNPWITSVPDLSLPVDKSAQSHGFQPPICQTGSDNERAHSNISAFSVSGNQDLRPPQLAPTLPLCDTSTAPRPHGGTTSFLAGASGFRMGDIQYFEGSYVALNIGGGVGDKSIDGWERLLENTAPNALHNSRARYDAPKCDEDTRVEVTSEIMTFIEDHGGPRRLLCMTGAAGSGKSALQQTIAETCGKKKSLGSSFFFSAVDPSRNTVDPVVPTIAYQLGRGNPAVRQLIKAAVEEDPLIFSQSLQDQITTLIVKPFEHLDSIGSDPSTFPYAILIDGLDECRGEDCQAELLTAIRKCLLDDRLPFRIFIASRPEWAIRTALEPGGQLQQVAYHIQLSDKYDASGDMCRYLRRRFEDIGLRIGNSKWFTRNDIETLVRAASGQFIYVATVFNYISERRAAPTQRLKIVLSWTPHAGQAAKPFEALDRLYTNILLTAKSAYEAVDTHFGRDFLLLFRAHHIGITGFRFNPGPTMISPSADILSALLCLEATAEEVLVSDLHSLVAFETDERGDLCLRLYHKSFSDFLEEESRAKDLFVSQSRVYAHLAKCCMQLIVECPLEFDSQLPAKWKELPLPRLHRRALREAIEDLPFFLLESPTIGDGVDFFTQKDGWLKLNKLLPLLYPVGLLHMIWQGWIDNFRRFSGKLQLQKPEFAVIINEFVHKWELEKKEWRYVVKTIRPL
ncbi:hypothetical protein H1R20_g7265, partial [Candolleomyces eurysporus]